jgi:hypothetical protein
VTPDEVRRWADYTAGSPLYTTLAGVIADDPWLMTVLDGIEHTPYPNVLLAAVALLLGRQPDHELAGFYPNLTPFPRPVADVGGPFRRFVAENEEAILLIGMTRYTQTNECRRCVALLPGIWAGALDRFHLIDIGTSAGLNLAIDRYSYRWDDVTWGSGSGVVLTTELRGRPPVPRDIVVMRRVGLDLNPVDTNDPEEMAWLEALIWPEQLDRFERLRAAVELTRSLRVELVRGDAVGTLPETLDTFPRGEPAVVMSSLTMNQLAADTRARLERSVVEARDTRPVHRVAFEVREGGDTVLTVDDGDGPQDIGRADPHGSWLELYALP